MNAKDFFSKQEFNQLQEKIKNEDIFNFTDTRYCKKVKVNGNSYEIRISGHINNYTNKYQVSGFGDWNYKDDKYYGRQMCGGTLEIKFFDGYKEFKESINNILKRFPDYEEDNEPEQISLF